MESLKPKELPDNPRETANFLSNLLFCHTIPIFFKGRRRDLQPTDLYKALEEDKASGLATNLSKAWDEEVKQKTKDGKEPKLFWAAASVFRPIIARLGIFMFCLEFCVKITQPMFIGWLVALYSNPTGNINEAYIYAGAVVLCSALNAIFNHSLMLAQIHCGMKVRIATIGMVYRKTLRLNKKALGDTTTGKIVNLITNDVGKLDLACIGLHQLWLGPIETVVIVYLLWQQIGVSAFTGVAFLVLFIPIQGFLGKKVGVLRARIAGQTDNRVRLMNEIIQGIQIIKMYAWEQTFGRLVADARKEEVKTIRASSYIKGVMLSFMLFVTRCSIFLSLVVYALLGQHISAEQAFVVTAYYAILRQSMTVVFPRGIAQLAETLVSFKRIETFMQYPETQVNHPVDEHVTLNGDPHTYISVTDTDSEEDSIVDMKVFARHHRKRDSFDQGIDKGYLKLTNVKAKWNKDTPECTIDRISFEANPGQLVAIVGTVGSGKSSIIQAILGEMEVESGTVEANGVISYAPQEPWVFSGTIRQNILFGYPMDKRRYRLAIRQCALERDLQQMPFGDRTIVGDRGQSLSGGQKARISLARAIYRRGSIYLLDDPLSSVDTHVGRHLFEQCMRKYLRKHIVVLVTNQLQFLEEADKIIIMKDGKMDAMGSFDELKNSGVDFASVLAVKKDKEEKEDDLVDLVANAALLREAYSRQSSIVSITSWEEPEPAPDTRLLMEEVQQYGSIHFDTYERYIDAGGGVIMFLLVIILCIAAQILVSGSDYFLAYWVNKEVAIERQMNATLSMNTTLEMDTTNETSSADSELPTERDPMDIVIFSSLILASIIVTLTRSTFVFSVAMKASRALHNAMYYGVSHATMFFFNTNPAGRILNRFSKDTGQIDELLPSIMMDMLQVFFALLGILSVISIVNVWFLIPAVLMILAFYFLRGFYLKTSRNVTRMEGVARSPVYSHLSASLGGLSTIRAFDAQTVLIHEFDELQDAHSAIYFTMISLARAFGLWLDVICVFYIAAVTLSFFIYGSDSPGNVGLAITQAIGMTGMVQWGMRQSAELENIMTAVERVTEYEDLQDENRLEKSISKKPPKEWPEKGYIRFVNLSLRYSPDPNEEPVLRNLEFEIFPREKVGIVGRTGAGKSSLINAIFRLSFNDGNILIDDRNTRQMSLYDLRSKISIIPQVPVLFSGSVRFNLDPFDEYPDARLWDVLEMVQLKQVVSDLPEGLNTAVTEGGANFSVGQRQLICLARTILRDNRILIMDEATANVDPQTDALILSTIRERFKNCTVITIAHRLNTIMQSDRVIVMDSGKIIESGIPYLLLTESQSRIFRRMARETGNATFSNFLKIAKEAYENKKDN